MARKRRTQTIRLERDGDGVYRLGKVGETLPGEGRFDVSAGVGRDLSTGLVVGPGGPYSQLPVPGSIGRWRGKGTKTDPYHWVGVSEKLLTGIAIAALVVWGAEVIETDISNWWSGSVVSVENDVSGLGQDVLNALGIPYTIGTNGKVASTAPRSHASFWTWFVQQVMVQGTDLEAATQTIDQLSTGFPSGSGLASPPPSS